MVSWANASAWDNAAFGSRGVVSVPATILSTTTLLLTPGSLPLPPRH